MPTYIPSATSILPSGELARTGPSDGVGLVTGNRARANAGPAWKVRRRRVRPEDSTRHELPRGKGENAARELLRRRAQVMPAPCRSERYASENSARSGHQDRGEERGAEAARDGGRQPQGEVGRGS